jgi:hypothetical protein
MAERKTFAEYAREYRKRKTERERHNALCAFVVDDLARVAIIADARGVLRLPNHDEAQPIETVRALATFLSDKGATPI